MEDPLVETKAFVSPNNFSLLNADIAYDGQKIRMLMFKEASEESLCNLNLIMPTSLPQDKEVSLDSIPLDFTAIGFKYDFSRNPEHREKLSSLFQKRIDMHMVSKKSTNILSGRQTPNGIEADVRLRLQAPNPDPQNFCKRYEVELSIPDRKETPKIVPESHWQEEGHHCMTGDENLSFPFIPIKDPNAISTLSMQITFDGYKDSQSLPDLLRGLPLSLIGTSQWYVKGSLAQGNFELFFNPEWGEQNTKFFYNRESDKRISPKEIHSAITSMSAIKNTLAEKLAPA